MWSHVTRMHTSCHTYERVVSHIWRSHVKHTQEPCQIYDMPRGYRGPRSRTNSCSMSHIWCHVKHMNTSCHTYEWVVSHIWIHHATHTHESCQTYQRVTHMTCLEDVVGRASALNCATTVSPSSSSSEVISDSEMRPRVPKDEGEAASSSRTWVYIYICMYI